MRLPTLTLAATLLAAIPALAHEAAGRNGGRITDAGKYHVELVAKDKTVEVYLLDGSEKPVPANGFKANATLVVGGKPARVTLAPADGNKLTGTAEFSLPANPKGAVVLTAPDGTSVSSKFN